MAQPNTDTCGILTKRASEQRLYSFEFSKQIEVAAGQTLSTPVVSANLMVNGQPTGTSDLTLGSAAISGTQVQFAVSGGTSGNIYRITCTAALSANSATLKEFGDLRVRN